MANLHRLAVAFVLCVIASIVYASPACRTYVALSYASCGPVAAPDCTNKGAGTYATSSAAYQGNASPQAVCMALVPGATVFMGFNFNTGAASNWYACELKTATTYYRVRVAVTEYDNCPSSSCQDYAGRKPNTTFHWSGTMAYNPVLCIPFMFPQYAPAHGCSLISQATQCYNAGGFSQCQGGGTFTGASCDPALPVQGTNVTATATNVVNTGTASVTPCDGYFGQVNGIDTCIPAQPDVVQNSTSNTVTTTSPTGTVTNSTTAGTSTTSCSGGVCTTITVTNSTTGGSSTGTATSSTTVPQTSFCKDNPTSPVCVTNGFGGSCTGNFTCTGDAVMCATAKAVNETNCKLFNVSSSESALYSSTVAAGTSNAGMTTTTVAISGASFSTVDLIGSPAGMTDRTVTIEVAGFSKTVTIPFSSVNPYLGYLGNLLVAVCSIAAMSIVFRKTS